MKTTPIKELAFLFLKLGTVAFGGPAAHISMMEDEVVRRRKWLTHEKFLDSLGAANLIPGPNSTELAIYIGYSQAGLRGLLLAGLCFILPAVLIVTLIAKFYVAYRSLPVFADVMYGIKPVVIAIIVKALLSLAKTAFKTRLLLIWTVFAVIMNYLGLNEVIVLLGGGLLIGFKQLFSKNNHFSIMPLNIFVAANSQYLVMPLSFGLCPLFFIFLKIGAVLFGGGYVLLAFLQADLVEHYGWITQHQLLDAIAVGQVTPGPVFTTATFIGYILDGWKGAIVATVGIFLPSFVLVGLTGPFISKFRKSAVLGSFLDGVNSSAVALMLVVVFKLLSASFVDVFTVVLGIVSFSLLFFTSINSAWLILLCGIIGYFSF